MPSPEQGEGVSTVAIVVGAEGQADVFQGNRLPLLTNQADTVDGQAVDGQCGKSIRKREVGNVVREGGRQDMQNVHVRLAQNAVLKSLAIEWVGADAKFRTHEIKVRGALRPSATKSQRGGCQKKKEMFHTNQVVWPQGRRTSTDSQTNLTRFPTGFPTHAMGRSLQQPTPIWANSNNKSDTVTA